MNTGCGITPRDADGIRRPTVHVVEDDRLRCLADSSVTLTGVHTCRHKAANKCSQVNRPISTGELNALLHLHFQPINLVFYQEPAWETLSWSGLRAYMLSALILSELSYPAVPLAR